MNSPKHSGAQPAFSRYIFMSKGHYQDHQLYQTLHNRVGHQPIYIDASTKASLSLINDESLVFVDVRHFSSQELQALLAETKLDLSKLRVVFFNADNDKDLELPLAWPACIGILSPELSEYNLERALTAVLHGELWFSRGLTTKLLQYLLENDSSQRPLPQDLTPKEIKVLAFLVTGASNTKLAESMNLSEHTIKSHLYRIYRKIEVKNRSEAIIWCHTNLPNLR